MSDLSFWELLARLSLALVLGGFIGFDRQATHKPAGLRTMMLVGLGAAAFTLLGIVSLDAVHELTTKTDAPSMNLDPGRVIAGIIGGIGFLGAGAIIRSEGQVRGITTASAIWVTAAIGVASGLGQFMLAAITTALAIFTLGLFHWLAPIKHPHDDHTV